MLPPVVRLEIARALNRVDEALVNVEPLATVRLPLTVVVIPL